MEELSEYTQNFAAPLKKIEAYMAMLNEPPKNVKINQLANNKEFVPIGEVEKTLDEFYSGLWSTYNFEYKVVANEIIGSIILEVFHPVGRVWIKRTGAAAVMIQTNKGTAATVENKIKNTLIKDFPHLKSECVKNAAKSLGVVFGRNLNRDAVSEFETLSEKIEVKTEKQILIDNIYQLMIVLKYTDEKIKGSIKRAEKATLEQLKTWYAKLQTEQTNNKL